VTNIPKWTPVPKSLPRRKALEQGLQKLLQKNAIRRIDPAPDDLGFFSTLFLVEKKSGGWRPILNLKKFNKVVRPQKFRMETLRNVLHSLGDSLTIREMYKRQEGTNQNLDHYAISIDLEDAYFHVPIHKEHRKYLRFAYRGQLYEFLVLPFGLSTAPRTFTRLVRVIAVYLKIQGTDMFQYLDDWFLMADSIRRTVYFRELTLRWVRRLGFLLNVSK